MECVPQAVCPRVAHPAEATQGEGWPDWARNAHHLALPRLDAPAPLCYGAAITDKG